MRDIVNAPIFLRLGSRLRGPAGTPVGDLRRVSISHVVVYNADARSAAIISGVPGHPIEDVTLSDIQFWSQGGGTKAQAAIEPPEDEAGYPEPANLGPMPAVGFFLRHVRGITLDNIQVRSLTADQRPAFALEDVADADFQQIKAPGPPGVSVFALKNVTSLRVHQSVGLADTQKDRVEQGKL